MELEEAGVRRGGRRQRFSVEQKRQIVEATLVPGASVALVARERGVNANQVFAWRKSYQQGLLGDRGAGGVKLLPVHVAGADVIASASRPEVSPPRSSGAIHMEFPGKALVTVEGSPSAESLRVILECLLR
jgi:transposase